MFRVIAVIVTYKPDIQVLCKTINSIIDQVHKIIIVDNTEDGFGLKNVKIYNEDKIKVIKLYDNYGIAKAQNIGIKKAIESGAEYIMLSDQDTEYPPKYVENMVETILTLSSNSSPIAAIGPSFLETHTNNRQPFVILEGICSRKIYTEKGYLEVSQLIASGMIIPVKIIDAVGMMNEELFIDWVDLEWCWRARSKGFRIIGNANIVINHTMGDRAVKVGSKKYTIRSPIRHYYIIRNGLHLAIKCNYINFWIRIRLFLNTYRYLIGFTALSKPHIQHLKYCLLGIYHGFLGRLGKL